MWELTAREAIRDLVARYNANADSGRFEQVLELFAEDAVLELDDGTHRGREEIGAVLTGTRDRVAGTADRPARLHHFTATHQIDVLDRDRAEGRCYYQVLTPAGVDHWGRYLDTYRRVDGWWRFARRRVTVDGAGPGSIVV